VKVERVWNCQNGGKIRGAYVHACRHQSVLGIAFAWIRRDFLQGTSSHIECTDAHRCTDPLVQIEACPVDLQRRYLVVEQTPGLGSVADNVDAAFSRLFRNTGDRKY